MGFYDQLRDKTAFLILKYNLYDCEVEVKGKILEPVEAIGKPERRDYPLLKGKEFLIEANFEGCRGQAFTDQPSNFKGLLKEILAYSLQTNGERAVYIATLNAVMRYLKMAEKTIHCLDEEPEECAERLVEYLRDNYAPVKVGMVGLQPAMLDHLSRFFSVRVLDLDPDNIGVFRYGVLVEHGIRDLPDLLAWADILLVTGSTVVNGTIENFWQLEKPVIFFGTTIAGPAALMNLKRFCWKSK